MNTPVTAPPITPLEEHHAKLEMTKAFCETAKSYIQIASAALALPVVFVAAIFGTKAAGEEGVQHLRHPRLIYSAWFCFLLAIAFGLLYQWASIRRVWDEFHDKYRTAENCTRPGYRRSWWVITFGDLNLASVWFGMTLSFYTGAILFTLFAVSNIW